MDTHVCSLPSTHSSSSLAARVHSSLQHELSGISPRHVKRMLATIRPAHRQLKPANRQLGQMLDAARHQVPKLACRYWAGLHLDGGRLLRCEREPNVR